MSDQTKTPKTVIIDPSAEVLKEADEKFRKNTALGVILDTLAKHNKRTAADRMAFEVDPTSEGVSTGVFRRKKGLVPDYVLKQVAGPQGDDLVNQIIQARSNVISSFGRPRTSRFSVGFEFQGVNEESDYTSRREEAEQVKNKISKLKEILWNCGHSGLDEDWSPNLSQFLKMIVRDILTVGRCAIEFIYSVQIDERGIPVERCTAFRAVDAGTIYRLLPAEKKNETRRKQAIQMLSQIKDKEISEDKYDKDEYKWVQTVGDRPIQVFTDRELVVYNVYPTTNIEYNGYPLTPIDQALNAVTTHINITLHNKLYFEHGRASRGILIIQSDDIDEGAVQVIRNQMHQSINSVQNAWRIPVFGVGAGDNIVWTPMDVAGRDKEFQYLSDDNARVIMGAFQISPDELPGYSHLSRGTNTQSLSESDNEFKLTAARDVGLRPLLYDIQDLFNAHIIPKFDKSILKTHQLVLAGIEKDSPEREAARLLQDTSIHMTYDEILERVEKKKIGKTLGGELPLSSTWQNSIAPFMSVGMILESFFGVPGASQDPRFDYYRDPFWIQHQQIMLQKAQISMQQQMMQQQMMQQQMMQQQQQEPPPNQPQQEAGESDEQYMARSEDYKTQIGEWMSKNYEYLNKSIANNHSEISKMILKRHEEIANQNLDQWEKESKAALEEIMNALEGKYK